MVQKWFPQLQDDRHVRQDRSRLVAATRKQKTFSLSQLLATVAFRATGLTAIIFHHPVLLFFSPAKGAFEAQQRNNPYERWFSCNPKCNIQTQQVQQRNISAF